MKCTHRLVYCNDQFHVILPNKWVNAVNIQKGDYVTLEIDNNDLNKLIVRKRCGLNVIQFYFYKKTFFKIKGM